MRRTWLLVLVIGLLMLGSALATHAQGGTNGIVVMVFRDANGDAAWNPGEAGVAGATVRILYRGSQPAGQQATGGDGTVVFPALQDGFYLVQLLSYPGGYTPSTGTVASVVLGGGTSRYVYFGLKPAAVPTATPTPVVSARADFTATASVCITSWNGRAAVLRYTHTARNVGTGAGAMPVNLLEAYTGQGGGSTMYWTGAPVVTLNPGQSWTFSRDVTISNWTWAGTAAAETWPNKYGTVPEANTSNNRSSTGFIAPGWCSGAAPRVYGYAFEDRNGNGRRDPGEPRANVTVQLWQAGQWKGNASPAGSGYWAFDVDRNDLARGTNFVVTAVAAAGVRFTTPNRYYLNVTRTSAYGPYLFGIAATTQPTPTPTPAVQPTPTPTLTPPSACWPPKEWVVEKAPTGMVRGYSPRFPVVVGQGGRGFDVSLSATGGWAELRRKEPQKRVLPGGGWEWVCVERVVRRETHPLVSVEVRGALSAASRRWIEGHLASRYYGATVRDPGVAATLFRGVRMAWTGAFHYEPVDPGLYAGEVVFRFRGSSLSPGEKVLIRPFAVPVSLVDTTLER